MKRPLHERIRITGSLRRFVWLHRWMHDAPANVVRFPVFTTDVPNIVVIEACAHFKRRPLPVGDLILLEPRK